MSIEMSANARLSNYRNGLPAMKPRNPTSRSTAMKLENHDGLTETHVAPVDELPDDETGTIEFLFPLLHHVE
ncbi:Protein of unknown function [Pyronema omphalodes CBS 100304]|uniref:Uncharacterized protein n=1 Tax=Pyronema omphalodes (strain CBS 100304) TaxID=1076935 RepID=U4LH47_PYROM|nr:Protein of unknown function [Pyronema omphalodes CBS 100304]